jgi:hypothetical protein
MRGSLILKRQRLVASLLGRHSSETALPVPTRNLSSSILRASSSTLPQLRSFSDLVTKNDNLPADTRTSKDGVVGRSIDFDIAAKIEGNESQIVTIQLEPGQVLRAESGAMMYMTDKVTMNTTTGGGMSTGFQRMLTGQNFFIRFVPPAW